MRELFLSSCGVKVTNLLNDSAWIKATSLIKEKYGKNLSYRSIKLITDNDDVVGSRVFYSRGEDLIIPLKLKNTNLGDIVVSRGSLLDQQQKYEILDLVKFIVEPKVYSLQLRRSEENLANLNSKPLSLVNYDSIVDLYESDKFIKKTLSPFLLLKSHTELTRNKVAFKIHEMTQRNLFVHLEDIINSLATKDDLNTLNDITIYVRDIKDLSKSTLNLLQDYLNLDSQTGPLFLFGTSLDLDALSNQSWPETLKKDLSDFYFDIDRVPLSQQTSPEILELLFFQLDSVLS